MRLFGNSHARVRRSVPRTEAALIAVLSTSAADHPAELIDVSRTGARLTGKLLPGVGEEVTFTAESVTVAASVVWCMSDACAVEFDTPIAASEVQRLR